MNSYWIEQQARQHISELTAEARGNQLLADAAGSESARRDRPIRALPRHRWLRELVARSRRELGRAAR